MVPSLSLRLRFPGREGWPVPTDFLGTEPLLPLPCPPPLAESFEHDSYSGPLWTRHWTPAFSVEIPSTPVQPALWGRSGLS